MLGAPEILQFNSRVNSSPQYVFLEAFRGTYPILEREVITLWESVPLDPYSRGAREMLRGAGPIQGWPYLILSQYLVSLLTSWAVTNLYDRHVRVAEAVMRNSCNFIVDKLRSSNLNLSRTSLKGDWLDGWKGSEKNTLSLSVIPYSDADLLKLNLLISVLLMDFSIPVTPWRRDGVYPVYRTMLFFAENLLVLSVIWCTLKSMTYCLEN